MIDDGQLHRGVHHRGSLPGRATSGHVGVDAPLLTPRGLIHVFEGTSEYLANGSPTARRVVPPSPRTPHQPSRVEAPWRRLVATWNLLPRWRTQDASAVSWRDIVEYLGRRRLPTVPYVIDRG